MGIIKSIKRKYKRCPNCKSIVKVKKSNIARGIDVYHCPNCDKVFEIRRIYNERGI